MAINVEWAIVRDLDSHEPIFDYDLSHCNGTTAILSKLSMPLLRISL